MLQQNENNGNKKYSKYEEVIIKAILANQLFEKNFFNDEETVNWRKKVDEIYASPDFDGDEVLAQFIISGSYDNSGPYKNKNNSTNFIPDDVINKELDPNVDKKYITNIEEVVVSVVEEISVVGDNEVVSIESKDLGGTQELDEKIEDINEQED